MKNRGPCDGTPVSVQIKKVADQWMAGEWPGASAGAFPLLLRSSLQASRPGQVTNRLLTAALALLGEDALDRGSSMH